ncbi:MAG: HAMP domain-containing sensor histidine kinase [Acidimicrobiales bacterium]
MPEGGEGAPEVPPAGERGGSRSVSLRLRIILAGAAAVAVAVLLAATGALLTVRHELRYQVDVSLTRNAEVVERLQGSPLAAIERRLRGVYQLLDPEGQVVAAVGAGLPVTAGDRAVAQARAPSSRHDAKVEGVHLRVLTVGLVGGGAAQLTAPLDAVDATLKRLVVLLAFLVLGGVALAAALGTLVARAALVPVERLTGAAERVAATMDLSASIDVTGADEIARLGRALNALLEAVDRSQKAQRRLVADASHELRTPLTSLRTNLELLVRTPEIDDGSRQAILGDLVAQAVELSTLVGQLVDLEREPLAAEAPARIDLHDVIAGAVARARLHSPHLHFRTFLEPTVIVGRLGTVERAVSNLLDNAAKWSPPEACVDVQLLAGIISVRDYGPGIDPADAPYVFDRFYRSPGARALPGSGLGLSIVRQAADDHGGRAWLTPAPGGGTVACLSFPILSPAVGEDRGASAQWAEPV